MAKHWCLVLSHITVLSECGLANQALHCNVDASLSQPPHHSQKRRAGRSCSNWLKQIRQDTGTSLADLWHKAIKHTRVARCLKID